MRKLLLSAVEKDLKGCAVLPKFVSLNEMNSSLLFFGYAVFSFVCAAALHLYHSHGAISSLNPCRNSENTSANEQALQRT